MKNGLVITHLSILLTAILLSVVCLSCGSSNEPELSMGRAVQVLQGERIPDSPAFTVKLESPAENSILHIGRTLECVIEVSATSGDSLPQNVVVEMVQGNTVVDSCNVMPFDKLTEGRVQLKAVLKAPKSKGKYLISATAVSYANVRAKVGGEVLKTVRLVADSASVH